MAGPGAERAIRSTGRLLARWRALQAWQQATRALTPFAAPAGALRPCSEWLGRGDRAAGPGSRQVGQRGAAAHMQ
jgi:hypothetical protein